jgi:hypothetical protein
MSLPSFFSDMSYFDDIVPQNTPESSSDPFVAALTSVMDPQQQRQDQMPPCNNFNQQQDGYQLPPGSTGGGGGGGIEQTLMWQHSNYMGPHQQESGFISETNTQPTSRTGHEDDCDGGSYHGGTNTGPSSITGPPSLYDLDSHVHSEVSSMHSTQGFTTNPEEFVPKMVEMLMDEDLVVADEGLRTVEQYSKRKSFLYSLVQSPTLVTTLVKKLQDVYQQLSTTAPEGNAELFATANERATVASRVLYNMSNIAEGRRAVVMCGGVEELMKFTNCPLDRVMHISLTTIHTIILATKKTLSWETEIM